MKKTSALLLLPAMLLMASCTAQTQLPGSSPNTPNLPNNNPPPAMDSATTPPKEGDKIAVMETDFGTIKIKLFTNDVPGLSKNFIELAQAGKYDNTPFHRVVKDFMIQGGDFTDKNGTGGYSFKGPDTFLPNEINPAHRHIYGTISMAKTSAPVSIGSQFFIVTSKDGASFLDGKYSPFGQVYEGMDVAEKIQNLQVPGTEAPSKIVNVNKVLIQTYTDGQTAQTQN